MSEYIYISLLCFIAVLTDLFFGTLGIILPVTAVLVFYLTVTYGWRIAVIAGITCGILLDSLYGRQTFITPFIMLPVIATAIFWLLRGESKTLELHVIPGAVIAFFYIVPLSLMGLVSSGISLEILKQHLANIMFGLLVSALMLPVAITILDYCAELMEFERYSDAKDKIVARRP